MIFILRGASGCGKSAYAKQLQEKEGGIILSTDKIREELLGKDWVYDKEDNGKVFAKLRSLINQYSGSNNVIIDATNLMTDKKLVNIYKQYRQKIKIIDVNPNITLDQLLKQNANRDRVVPEDIVRGMYNTWMIVRNKDKQ